MRARGGLPRAPFLAAALFCFLVSGVRSLAQEKALLKVVLNTVDRGDYFVLLTEGGDVLFPMDELPGLGVQGVDQTAVVDNGFVSLRSLAPGVTFELDDLDASLLITAKPELLHKQVIDLGPRKHTDVLYPRDPSAFLNYAVDYQGPPSSLGVPLELGTRAGPLVFVSTADITASGETRFTRGLTNVTFDDRASLFRGTGGDVVADSGGLGLGGGGVFGGVNVSKNFSLDPYFVRVPDAMIGEALATPSDVKMYVNDILFSDRKLAAGDFQFVNVPLPTGFSSVSLVMVDAHGNEKRVEIPVYRSSVLLAPGIDEYNYTAGFKRLGLGAQNFAYGDPCFLGFHRVGITDWLTGGLRGELDHDTANFGPTATFTLGQLGELDTSFAVSYNSEKLGYGAVVDYLYAARPFFGIVSLKFLSSGYATTSTVSTSGQPIFQGRLGLGFSHRLLGSLSGSVSYTLMQDGTNSQGFSVSYSRGIVRDLSLRATLNATLENGGIQYGGFIGANLLLGSIAGTASYANDGGVPALSTQIRSKVPRGPGFGFGADARASPDANGDWKGKGNASVFYRAPFGIFSALGGYDQDQNQSHYELNAAGSVVLIDSSLLFGRPIIDSFALVKVDGLPGVRVKYGGEFVGSTDEKGRVLVPDLVSYYENELTIEQTDISMDYEITKATSYISPPYKSGGVVDFKAARFHAITGRLFFVENGERSPAEYAGLEIEVENRKITTVVGMGGEFYLDEVPPGPHQGRLFTKDRQGSFNLVVPQSAKTVVDIGDIECTVTK